MDAEKIISKYKYKKPLFYKKKTAFAITAVVIALSFLLGGARGLLSQRNKAVDFFRSGTEYGSALNDIKIRVDNAHTLIKVAELCLDSNDNDLKNLNKTVANLENALKKEKNVDNIYKYNGELTRLADVIYKKADISALGDLQTVWWENAKSEMSSRANTIKNDGYNKKAADYNKKTKAFPAFVIRFCGLAKPLPIFQ